MNKETLEASLELLAAENLENNKEAFAKLLIKTAEEIADCFRASVSVLN